MNKKGVCGICRRHGYSAGQLQLNPDYERELMQKELDDIFNSASEGGGLKYDVLLLFSGGKDSAYVLHKLSSSYRHLRILTLTVDNHFMSPVALNNIDSVLSKINVDHMLYRPKRKTLIKMFAHALMCVKDRGTAQSVDQFDGDFLHDIARNIAVQMDIPFVVSAVSPVQVERILNVYTYKTSLQEERKKRKNVAGVKLTDLFTEDEMRYWWDGTSVDDDKIPRVLFPFYAWGYDESHIKKQVKDLGFLEKGAENPIITNNQLLPLMGFVDIKRFGYFSFEPEMAELVRNGSAERKFWRNIFEFLEYSARTERFISKSVDNALDKLLLTRRDVGFKK
ncbi:MAG: hypothetical protein ACQEP6_00790 [Patescibacteria group bacterium]